MYRVSGGRTDWCGICYGSKKGDGTDLKKWVAYTNNGDVALLTVNDSDVSWQYISQALNNAKYTKHENWYGGNCAAYPAPIAYKRGRFVICSRTNSNYTAYSDDGVNWYRGENRPISFEVLTANDRHFVGRTYGYGISYSEDGIKWHGDADNHGQERCSFGLTWNGSQLVTSICYGGNGAYTTTDKTGMSGWSRVGDSYIVSDYETFVYGGGYYVKKGVGNSTTLRSSTSMFLGSNNSTYNKYILPWNKYSVLNYGPGYWLIMTQYGDLLKSTDASATDWAIFDGSKDNTTSSRLYSKSGGRTDWCGICYGANIKKWVAYTNNGDIALLTMESTTNAGVRFPYIQSTNANPTTSSNYTFSGKKEFYIEADQINEGSDGAYKLTVNLENVRLISAEITNRHYTKGVTGDNVTVTFSALTKPARSSVLDFSSSSLTHNSNLVEYGTNLTG